MEKELYESAEMEIVEFLKDDVISTSSRDEDETPVVPANSPANKLFS